MASCTRYHSKIISCSFFSLQDEIMSVPRIQTWLNLISSSTNMWSTLEQYRLASSTQRSVKGQQRELWLWRRITCLFNTLLPRYSLGCSEISHCSFSSGGKGPLEDVLTVYLLSVWVFAVHILANQVYMYVNQVSMCVKPYMYVNYINMILQDI